MKNRQFLIRLLSIIAVLMLMLTSVVACVDTGDGSDETTTGASDTGNNGDVTTDSNTDANGYIKDQLPDELDYNKDPLTVLAWNDVEHEEFEFDYESLNGDIVEESIYNRNIKVEERLGITLSFLRVDGDSDNRSNWNSYVHTAISSGARSFDIIAGYSLSVALNASSGYCYNMLDPECEYLNFNNPWWSSLLVEQASFGDNLYFASGDISRNALEMMYVCYCNTDLLDEYQLENPQNLAKAGDWTYEAFFNMCTGVYRDLDGNGEKNCASTSGDQFGYVTSGIHNDPWFYGSGATICERSADGSIIASPSFAGDRVISTIELVNSNLWNTDDCIYTSSVTHQKAFGEGRVLLMMERARVSHKVLAASYGETNFVILPCPKYNTDQENYITVMGNPFTLYAIVSDVDDPSRASAFVECFASEGYRIVTPAVFELSLKSRYVDDPVSAELYDEIRANITYDLGRIFSSDLVGQGHFRTALEKNQTNWSSTAKAQTSIINKKLTDLNNALMGE